ncbi:2174_t:CDS:1 [Funneliformis geosporum]|uniref:14259_t:CDS:1 n=1 Tax=Funneliformis geosporum TaxID=1117311 RepID=A0A9W4SAF0_9GLOM|nr:14259_t:CDS:1 [Funneliformis geosporum]CAI2162567.1 2174_t:CDS:1 [Funneliformis geosporum]
MPNDNEGIIPRRSGRKMATGKVINAILDSSKGINRCLVIVSLNDGFKIEFPVPTTQEIRDRFFYKRAKTQPEKPARPPNKFFIFRTMFQGAIDDLKLQVPIVSGLASEVWKKCSPEVVELFTKLSQIAKTEHGVINPGYVYKPNRDKSRNMKAKNNPRIREKTSQDANNSLQSPPICDISPEYLSTAPVWTAPPNYFAPNELVNIIPSNNSYMMNESITTEQNYQTIPSQCTYASIDLPIHPITHQSLGTIHDACRQFYKCPKILYCSNNEFQIDQFNALGYEQDGMRHISTPGQPIPYFSTIRHMNFNNESGHLIFGSPVSERNGVDLLPEQIHMTNSMTLNPHHYTILQNPYEQSPASPFKFESIN